MGIVNMTPDSFSDGGQFVRGRSVDHALAIDHALRLADRGAAILDVGGESTRPYADPVGDQEELDRVIPVIRGICDRTDIPVSVDTSKSSVARAAIEAGAEIINDITGLQGDPEMLAVAATSNVGVCAMHMQGTPQTMQDNPTYDDVVSDILGYLASRRDALIEAGIDPSRICLDPGIGFGKRQEHNLKLMANCDRFHRLGCPILVGHSRKGFLAKILGDKRTDQAPDVAIGKETDWNRHRENGPTIDRRLIATVASSMTLARKKVQVLRVHDVGAVFDALTTFAATGGLDELE